MLRLAIIGLVVTGLHNSLCAQALQGQASESPTSFQNEVNLETPAPRSAALEQSPAVHGFSRGGRGKAQGARFRALSDADTALSLEGIRLNSLSGGDYDLSELNFWGLSRLRVLRGGYAPFNTNPGGQLQFFLPRDDQKNLRMLYGSHKAFGLGLRLPSMSLSFENAKNDFLYDNSNAFVRRTHNDSRNLNLRMWKRWKGQRIDHQQSWFQFLFSDQNLPGPVSQPSTVGFQQSHDVLGAYQGREGSWSWDLWANARHVESEDEFFSDRSFSAYSGAQLGHSWLLHRELIFKNHLGLQSDHFKNSSLSHRQRGTLFWSPSLLWTPAPGLLVHPHSRIEFVSDLKNKVSLHGGLGLRWALHSDFSLLANSSWISRVPDFYSLYFESPGILSNPDLNRQQVWQSDAGFEWQLDFLEAQIQQAFFWIRGFDLIRSVQLDTLEFQAQNFSDSWAWGSETQFSSQPLRPWILSAHYTYTKAKVDDRPEAYVPSHKIFLSSRWQNSEAFFTEVFWRFKSSVPTSSQSKAPPLPRQSDLALILGGQREQWQYNLRLENLLGWRLINRREYPLPQERTYEISVSRSF